MMMMYVCVCASCRPLSRERDRESGRKMLPVGFDIEL